MAQVLIGTLAAIPAPAAAPHVGAANELFTVGVTLLDYQVPLVVDAAHNRGRTLLRVITKGVVDNNANWYDYECDVVAADRMVMNPGWGPADWNALTNEEWQEAFVAAQRNVLRAVRLAGDGDRNDLDEPFPGKISTQVLAVGWREWRAETPEDLVVQLVETLARDLSHSPLAEISIPATRLLNRGWTSLRLVMDLVRACQTEEARDLLARAAASLEADVRGILRAIAFLRANPQVLRTGFYTGVPEAAASRNYKILAALAYRVLETKSLRRYGGGLKHVLLADSMSTLKDELRDAVAAQAVNVADDEYVVLMQQVADALSPLLT